MGFKIKEKDRKLLADIINAGMEKLNIKKLPFEVDGMLNSYGIQFVDFGKKGKIIGFDSKYYALTDDDIGDRKKRGG